MDTFDEMRAAAKELAAGHKAAVGQGAEKAGDFVDGKTGGKFSAQVDQAEELVTRKVTGRSKGRDVAGEAAKGE